jgi:hypothetical protein
MALWVSRPSNLGLRIRQSSEWAVMVAPDEAGMTIDPKGIESKDLGVTARNACVPRIAGAGQQPVGAEASRDGAGLHQPQLFRIAACFTHAYAKDPLAATPKQHGMKMTVPNLIADERRAHPDHSGQLGGRQRWPGAG